MRLLPSPRPNIWDVNGIPLVNGTLNFFVAGTTTPKAVFLDAGGVTSLGSIVTLNSRGEATVFLNDDAKYKLIVKDSSGTIIYTIDEICGIPNIATTDSQLGALSGLTASTAELNILDGATLTTAELNILDGATVTFSELNILDGATLSTAELNLLDGVTASTAELNYVDTTAGTLTASKAVVVDSSSNIDQFKITGDLTHQGAVRNPLFEVEVTATVAQLNSGAVTVQTSSGSERYKVRDITVTNSQAAFDAGGDKGVALQDSSGTVVWTVVTSALLKSQAVTQWGTTGVPGPAIGGHVRTASTAGENIVVTYSGGTTNYASGTLHMTLLLEKTA